jgi:hypothetical protein
MEKDTRLEKLMKEAGLAHTPANFTGNVMQKISAEPERTAYKPIIGRGGRLLILFFVTAIVMISVIYSEPGARFLEYNLDLPEFDLNLGFLSEIRISTGILSALAALFILVLSDAGISRKKAL